MSYNTILNMPFDEPNGSLTAYDYSASRADGVINGASFVAGRNGNAINFNGSGTCEISSSVIGSLTGAWTISAWVRPGAMAVGTPTKLIWLLNYSNAMNDYATIEMGVPIDKWSNIALTHADGVFGAYVNGALVQTIIHSPSLIGISLNQDCYCEYGLADLDDMKIYDNALTATEIMETMTSTAKLAYLLDGKDIKDEYGVFVSASEGIIGRPKMKTPTTSSWKDYHGECVDLAHKYLEPREITLTCFIKAAGRLEFMTAANNFLRQFDKPGTNRLMIDVHPTKPLIYEVYLKDKVDISKTWSDHEMTGTFKIKLVEPEPVKRILKHVRVGQSTSQCQINIQSTKCLNIYWGDGSVEYDVHTTGTPPTDTPQPPQGQLTHTYTADGVYFIVITGCISEITSMTTNAIVVWNEL